MLTATCHCGALESKCLANQALSPVATVPSAAATARYGRITRRPPCVSSGHLGSKDGYSWGGKRLRFVRCSTCGCITHWESVRSHEDQLRGRQLAKLRAWRARKTRIRLLDGAGQVEGAVV